MPSAQYRNRKTPGVYVTEFPAFPPSVVGVPTAIPVFVGYTEKAEVGGKSVTLRPVRIDSAADYEEFFGKGFSASYSLTSVDDPTAPYDFRVWNPTVKPPKWAAYRLSPAGTGGTTADAGGAGGAPATGGGADEAPKTEGGTDGAPKTEPGTGANPAPGAEVNAPPATAAPRAAGATVPLDHAAPLPQFNLYNSIRLFYANGGATCYVVSVGAYRDNQGNTATVSADALTSGLSAAAEQTGPTMIVVPDAVLLGPKSADKPWISEDFQKVARAMLRQASSLQDRIAILDVYGAQYANTSDYPDASLDTVISQFREDVGENDASNGDTYLSYGAAYFPFLRTTVIPLSDVSYLNIDPDSRPRLMEILGWENTNLYPPAPSAGAKPAPGANTADAAGAGSGGKAADGAGDAGAESGGTTPTTAAVAENPRHALVAGLIAAIDTTDPKDADAVTQLNNNLVAALPVLKTIEQQVIAHNNVLPASAAMAGIYTAVDNTSGVWNAPANVVLSSVDGPTLKLNSRDQEDLNLPVNGKAVDALRAFPGRGTVVWGARTLDGNSPDFRYVQVRRTLIYLEQSIKAALEPFVFAPNTGQTWATVTSMVSGFLTGVWSRGGLMGAKPSEAFSVSCGLGSTMTGHGHPERLHDRAGHAQPHPPGRVHRADLQADHAGRGLTGLRRGPAARGTPSSN